MIDDVDIKNGTSVNGGNITIYSGKLTTTDNTVISGGTGRGGSHATYGGNIYLINAKTGTLLEGSITDGCALNGGNVYVAGSTTEGTPSTVEIAANISGGVAKYGSNVGAITGSPNKTNALYQLNLIFSGGTIKEGTLEDLNNGGSMAANAHIFVNTPAANADGVKVTLKGDFTNEQTTYITKAAEQNTLTVDPSWTGSTGFSAGTPYYVGATISDGFATEMNGTLTNTYGSPVKIVADGNGGLKLVDFELVTTADNAGGFANAADAVAAYQTALAEDANARIRAGEDFTLNGNVVIEPIGDITVDGTGEISGVDLGNDDYAGNSGSITPAGNVTVAQETNYQNKRYIALTGDANGVNNGTAYTFHRLQVKLTNVTINLDKAGLYYKAEYKFDDKVQARAEAYGVFVALNKEATAESENYTSADVADATIVNHTLTMASHGVYGILKAAREPAANVAASQSVLNGNPYITINWNGAAHEAGDASYIYMGTNVAQSLQSAIELADEKWEQLAPASQEALNAFVEHWNGLSAFDADFIADLVNVDK